MGTGVPVNLNIQNNMISEVVVEAIHFVHKEKTSLVDNQRLLTFMLIFHQHFLVKLNHIRLHLLNDDNTKDVKKIDTMQINPINKMCH